MTAVLDRVIFDAEISERRILILPLKTLRHTPYNPPNRTEVARLSALMETVKRHGQQYPILIDDARNVIDGNRRLAACRALGFEKVECIVSTVPRDDLYGPLNSTSERFNNRSWLQVARGGGLETLPQKARDQYRELHELVGNYGIDLLIQQKLGLGVLALCKLVCAQGTSKGLDEVVMLCALKRLTNKLNAILRSDLPREEKAAKMDALMDAESGI